MFRARNLVILVLCIVLSLPLAVFAQDDIPTETYQMLVGELAFTYDYPKGWVSQDSVGVSVFVSNSALLQTPADKREFSGNDGLMLVGIDSVLYFMWDQFDPIESLEKVADWVGGKFASLPNSGKNDFENLQIVKLTNGNSAAIETRPDKSEGFYAGIAVVEYQPKNFMIFYVVMPFEDSQQISAFLLKIANSLKVGNDVTFQEQATVVKNEIVKVDGLPLGIGDNRVYLLQRNACGKCNLEVSVIDFAGKLLKKIDLPSNILFVHNVIPVSNDQFWAVIDGGMGYGGSTVDLALFSSDGKIIRSLGLNDNAASITIRSDLTKYLYVAVTDRIKPVVTQAPAEVLRQETKTYVMVLTFDGSIVRQFDVSSEEYDIGEGINGLAITSDARIYLGDSYGQKGITIFDEHGKVLKEGIALGQFQLQPNITSLDVVRSGDIFLGKYLNYGESGMVVHLDKNGSVLSSYTAESLKLSNLYPPALVKELENGNLLVTAFSRNVIQYLELNIKSVSA